MTRRELLQAVPAIALAARAQGKTDDDILLRAMQDELERVRTIQVPNLDKPYYIEFGVSDLRGFSVQASLGALIGSDATRLRIPAVRVRVGDPSFDNSDYILSDFYSGARYDADRLPIDDDYAGIRRLFWLATDRAYKTALESIGRKRAAVKNVTVADQLPDFTKEAAAQVIEPLRFESFDDEHWRKRVKEWSAIFVRYPTVVASSVAFSANSSMRYLVNTEGTRVRIAEPLTTLQIRAHAYAPDGGIVRDAVFLQGESPEELPKESEVARLTTQLAENVVRLAAAPIGDDYSGPVLFEGVAGPQIMAEVLGTELTINRRPLGEPGRPVPFRQSELEGRIGSRILPEYLDIVDDPTRKDWEGTRLIGNYPADEEGVVPKPLPIIEKGYLKNVLLTRQPVKGFDKSNGRARLPGAFGAKLSAYSNLIVSATQSAPQSELKKRLLELCAARNKPFGLIVRKMDFPSSAAGDELRRIFSNYQQAGGNARPVSIPLLMYRVYPDGREEPVRSIQFRGFGVRSLKDIVAVSTERYVFGFLNSAAPFAVVGGATFVAPSSVVGPSLLFEDVELVRPREDRPNPPLVPPPPLI